ncbi:MAG: alpha-L-arabinofuranosidase C-terminal domain-containing protein [Ignavibacteriaceae bacterium]
MKKFLLLFLLISISQMPVRAQTTENKITINASDQEYKIDKNIYGQFSEHLGHLIYGGIWVGPNSPIPNIDGIRKDIVDALREIKVPVLRWPGGCFADEYHWMDGIGPRKDRPKMINTNWGGVTEDNSFGTHEFLELCRLIGCEPYITGNIGSGTVKELSQWVEYVNSDNVSPMTDLRRKNGQENSWGVKFWGIGNESWGCGGNMLPEYYADQVRRYGTYMHNYGKNKLFKIACGPSGNDYKWTDVLMKEDAPYFDGLALHYYSFANQKTATDFDEDGWFDIMKKTLEMKQLIEKHSEIMDKYDPFKRVALIVDEWGTWYKVEPGTNPGFLYQQNTMRDAIAAACNLNIFNNHCDRVRMTNIAQVVNVLQAMILTKDDKMILTPTYWVFDLFKVHQDAMMVPVKLSSSNYIYHGDKLPAVNCSASIDSAGRMHISLCNIDPDKSENVELSVESFKTVKISSKILTAGKMNDHNTFDNPDEVKPVGFSDFQLNGNNLKVNMPRMSIIVLELEGKVEFKKKEIKLKNPEQGLDYDYYEYDGSSLPNFADLKPKSSGTIENILIPKTERSENFALRYTGYIKIPEDGLYTFYTNSDDGSAVLIDGKLVVNNDGQHAMVENSGNVMLNSGYHRIEILFFQAGGGMGLEADIKGPEMKKQIIPADMLYREN